MKQKGFAHKVALGLALTGFSINPHFLRTREPMVSVARAQDVFKLPLNDIKKAITNGKKFEIKFSEEQLASLDGIRGIRNPVPFLFYYPQYESSSTLGLAMGGGVAIWHEKVDRNNYNRYKNTDDNDIGSPSFTTSTETPQGHRLVTLLEVPFKGPDGKERGLIVDVTPGAAALYAKNYDTGKWRFVGWVKFDQKELGTKPNVGIEFIEDGNINISVFNPSTYIGIGMTFFPGNANDPKMGVSDAVRIAPQMPLESSVKSSKTAMR